MLLCSLLLSSPFLFISLYLLCCFAGSAMMVDLDLVQMHIQSVSFGVRNFQKYSVVPPGLSDGIETPFVINRSTKDADAA